jgi:hypothetical protein
MRLRLRPPKQPRRKRKTPRSKTINLQLGGSGRPHTCSLFPEMRAMWLVLCSSADASALWAYQGLKRLGLASLELVTAESLACSSRWEHRLNSSTTQIKITLSNGLLIDGSQIRGVLNRLHAPSEFTSQRAVPSDRAYAQSELLAFYLSWMHALPGAVINRPKPMGLCGSWFHPSEWAIRASRAGLRTPVYRQAARDNHSQLCRTPPSGQAASQRLIALRGEVFGGEVPGGVAQACGRLVAEAETEMLGIDLVRDNSGEWTFDGAMPSPDLRPGGLPLLQRLAQILTSQIQVPEIQVQGARS